MNNRLLSILLLFSSLLIGRPAPGDWPQWLGPDRNGLSPETGLLPAWPADGPKLQWKANGLGKGYTAVAIAGNRIFTSGDHGDFNYVMALDRANGHEIWSTQFGKAGAPGWGGFAGPRGTPAADGDRLYAVGQYGEIACLLTATGKEVWRKHYVKDFGGTLPEWGFSGSPLVDGDQVIFMPGGDKGALVALNKLTGALIWQSRELTDPIHYASPIVTEIDGVRQYIQLTERSVAGVAAKDGRLLWRAPRQGRTAVIPTAIYHDHHVYVSSGYGVGCHLFQITKTGADFVAQQVYANPVMVNHHGGVLLRDGYLYGYSDGKGWTCQDFKTGEAVWQEKDKLGKGSIGYADGRLYLREESGKGTVVLLEASPDGYREHGRFDPPDRSKEKSWPHPIVAGGRLYLRDQDVLLSYDLKTK